MKGCLNNAIEYYDVRLLAPSVTAAQRIRDEQGGGHLEKFDGKNLIQLFS
jgi:hypothetical protein